MQGLHMHNYSTNYKLVYISWVIITCILDAEIFDLSDILWAWKNDLIFRCQKGVKYTQKIMQLNCPWVVKVTTFCLEPWLWTIVMINSQSPKLLSSFTNYCGPWISRWMSCWCRTQRSSDLIFKYSSWYLPQLITLISQMPYYLIS